MKKYLLLFLLSGTFVMMGVMAKTGESLNDPPQTPCGILNLEFAYNTALSQQVITAWAPAEGIDRITAAKNNTWLDFIFLFFYSLFLFQLCNVLSHTVKAWWYAAGKWLAKGALIAGVLDMLENTGMLLTLYGNIHNAISIFTFTCSLLKWLLVIAALLYIIIFGAIFLYKKLVKKS